MIINYNNNRLTISFNELIPLMSNLNRFCRDDLADLEDKGCLRMSPRGRRRPGWPRSTTLVSSSSPSCSYCSTSSTGACASGARRRSQSFSEFSRERNCSFKKLCDKRETIINSAKHCTLPKITLSSYYLHCVWQCSMSRRIITS